ncbi:MAG TPA: carboxypeptidase regulatory-like domain-containing protein [Oligoflexus sp.]|uniref:carboxypeptidase regulatory-like domain-containing protein n=1 Tax=Oligoflexus sp. TaxID=1971216 RepID=UPI002D57B437|nr:carboxypeptidase regulatory-like domain-containing protein [Oligoflexus sp.]HYX39698.1 carboxypeptidase regulatory-like domain-containing protein [Oligoflexus sp.]
MRCALAFFAMLVILQACSDESTDRVIHSTIPAETESSLIPTQALIISGSVANGEDASNTAVLQNKEVELIRNDGVVVAQGTTDASANFSVDIAAGALIIDSSFSTATGLAETGTAATSLDFTYTLQVKVPDDGSGRALGVRRKVEIAEESLTTDRMLDIGQTALKEVTAIIGNLAFADAGVTLAGADIFIPGKPFFVRTGDDGTFSLLFVPAGTYTIRITKGFYIKDVSVTVTAGQTTDLNTITVGSHERNPLPLSSVLPGTWQSKCYYNDIANGINPENPRTGTVVVTALDQVAVTGHSCLLRTFAAGDSFANFSKLMVLGDGAIVAKLTSFYSSLITSYTNDQIVMDIDNSSLASGKIIEVWTRSP